MKGKIRCSFAIDIEDLAWLKKNISKNQRNVSEQIRLLIKKAREDSLGQA